MFELFDHIICLNLPSRKDRKIKVSSEFAKIGILDRIEWFPAIPGGYEGFCQSQAAIFRHYKDNGNILVFEDDVKFINDIENIDTYLSELYEWDMIYLGANIKEKCQKVSDHIYRLTNGWTSHAIGYHHEMVTLLNILWNGKYVKPFIYDEWVRQKIQPDFKVFITKPMFCTQEIGYSDLMNKTTDYSIIEQSQVYYEH